MFSKCTIICFFQINFDEIMSHGFTKTKVKNESQALSIDTKFETIALSQMAEPKIISNPTI